MTCGAAEPPGPDREADGAILAVDYGLKRVGLAVCDPRRRTAVGVGSVQGLTGRTLARAVEKAALARQAATIIIGETEQPLSEGLTKNPVREGAERLSDALARAGFNVLRWNEANTTAAVLADRRRLGGKGKPARRWADEAAAILILQDYLDYLALPTRDSPPR